MIFSFPTLSKEDKSLFGVIFIALCLRILWAIVVPVIPVSDGHAYDILALNLANGYGYGFRSHLGELGLPSWPVGVSFIYSIFYRLFGHTYTPIVIFNLFLAGVTIAMAMHLAAKWFGQQVALLTGLLLALWPGQIQFTTVLASELIVNALVLLAMVIWFKDQTPSWSRSCLMAIVFAIASYVRVTSLLIPLLLLFFRWVDTHKVVNTLKEGLLIYAVMALLIAPWSIRNTLISGQFVLLSTNGGLNLWLGNNPDPSSKGFPAPVKQMNPAQRDNYLKKIAIAYIKEEPLLFIKRMMSKVYNTYNRETIGVHWNMEGLILHYGTQSLLPLKIVSQVFWLSVLGLAIIGIVLLSKQKGWTMMVHLVMIMWGYFTLVHAIFISGDRFHFYSVPMISMLSALALAHVFELFKTHQRTRSHQPSRSG